MSSKQIWAYCRVSTKLQAYSDDESLSTQINRCKLYGATRIYYDIDKRTKDFRPGLRELLEDIEKLQPGEVSELVFTRLDRVAASSVAFYTLLQALKKKSIKPVAIDDSLDLESVGGELSADIRLAVSKHEVKMLGLRVRKSLEYRRQQGIPHKMAFGYVLLDNKIAFDYTPVLCHLDEKLEYSVYDIVKKIFQVFDNTQSIRGTSHWITKHFGLYHSVERNRQRDSHVIKGDEEIKLPPQRNIGKRFPHCTLRFSIAMISYLLKNPVYSGSVGTRFQHDKTYITEYQHQKILDIIKKNKCNPKSDRTRNPNEYSGKIRCSICDGTVSRVFNTGRKNPYFYCRNAKVDGHCTNKRFIAKSNLDKQVVEQFQQQAEYLANYSFSIKERKEKSESPEVKNLKTQIRALKKISPSSEEIEGAIKSLQIKLESELVKSIEFKDDDEKNRKRFVELFAHLNSTTWGYFSILEKRKFFDIFVTHISLNTDKTIKVNWSFRD